MGMTQPKDPKPSIIFLYHRYLNDIQAKLTKDGKIDPDHPGNNSLKQWGNPELGISWLNCCSKNSLELIVEVGKDNNREGRAYALPFW